MSELNIMINTNVEPSQIKKKTRTPKYITEEQKEEQREKRRQYDKEYYEKVTLAKQQKVLRAEKTPEEIELQKELSRQHKNEYNKQYFQEHKQKMASQNKVAWKKRRQYLYELARTPEIVELFNKLKLEKNEQVSNPEEN